MQIRRNIIPLIIVVILIASFFSCKETVTIPETLSGRYEYTGFDSTGSVIVRGTISITKKDSVSLTGRWELQSPGNLQNIGPQTGSGTFAGSIFHDSTVSINLNPQMSDNNVFLYGSYHDIYISGKWAFSTLTGETNKGTFVAKQILLAL